MKKIFVEGRYEQTLNEYGLNMETILVEAGLEPDLFKKSIITMTYKEYYKFTESIGNLLLEPSHLVKMASTKNSELFSPLILASYCSENGITCLRRLSKYSSMNSPVSYRMQEKDEKYFVEFTSECEEAIPQFLLLTNMVVLVNILRCATQVQIRPLEIILKTDINNNYFFHFMGCNSKKGKIDALEFEKKDLWLPFTSKNDQMWGYFEPEFIKKIDILDNENKFSCKVKQLIFNLLPTGTCNIKNIADKLYMSSRSLQRKLKNEGTSYQELLKIIRKELLTQYQLDKQLKIEDIACMLGFHEANSLSRFIKQLNDEDDGV